MRKLKREIGRVGQYLVIAAIVFLLGISVFGGIFSVNNANSWQNSEFTTFIEKNSTAENAEKMTLENKFANNDEGNRGLGVVGEQTSYKYKDVEISSIKSKNGSGNQSSFTAEFDCKNSQISPYMYFGEKIRVGVTMSEGVKALEKSGKRVVFGINADAYDLQSKVAFGLMVNSGRLVSSYEGQSGIGLDALGFKADGSAVWGGVKLDMRAKINDKSVVITKINKERGSDASGMYLLTPDFATTTMSTKAGAEVIFTLDDEDDFISIGGSVSGRVKEVRIVEDNAQKNSVPLQKGDMVLLCAKTSAFYSRLTALKPNDKIEVSVSDPTNKWTDVVMATGVFQVLVNDGVAQDGVYTNKEVHPRTALGIRENGSMIALVTDGRNKEWSDGITFAEVADYFIKEGCSQVFNFDGGGSSTFAAYDPILKATKTLNQPSDGKERANCSYLMFVCDATPDTITHKIHITKTVGGEVLGDLTAESGETKTYKIVAESGYKLQSLKINGAEIAIQNDTITLQNITEDKTISAEFTKIASGCASAIYKVCNITPILLLLSIVLAVFASRIRYKLL